MNVRKREKKEIASRLPRHQKRDTFFISYLAYEKKKKKNRKEKKCKTEVKSAEDGAEGEIVAGRSAKK